MSYQGGKQKIGKKIYYKLLEIESELTDKKLDYIEPFIGFCGVMKHFNTDTRKLYAYDINEDIVNMWSCLQSGWQPMNRCSKVEWDILKNKPASPDRTLYGHVCSYGGVFFNWYVENKDVIGRKSVLKIADSIGSVNFEASDYSKLKPNDKLIYCDPPYLNNKLSNKNFKFDHDKFWNIMREWSVNNIVVISERIAPDDFKCVWEQRTNTSCKYGNKEYHIEKLFMLN